MSKSVVSYLRIAVCSLLAMAAAACARFVSSDVSSARPGPRYGEPPSAGAGVTQAGEAEDRVEQLEKQVAGLNADLEHLRRALNVMGPLPEQQEFFVPVALDQQSQPRAEPTASENYAVAPKLADGQSLFYQAELSVYPSRAAAEAGWAKLVSQIDLHGLEPRYTGSSSMVQLSAGPLTSEASVDALCIELAALAGPCRVTAPIRAYR